MKQPMGKALWSDCETDEERAVFFRSSRAWDTGVIAKDLAEPCARAFEDAAKWRSRYADFALKWNSENHQFSSIGTIRPLVIRKPVKEDAAKPTPPWGLDAVPLMVCPKASNCKLLARYHCSESLVHEPKSCCVERTEACPECVQIGWRERSKP